jgi:ferric-dicitrate binding protein FerR (iron transport regulator)
VEERECKFELLSAYFSGESSPAERVYVEEWISSSEENRLLARQVSDLLYMSETLFLMERIDAESGLRKMKKTAAGKTRMHDLKVWLQRAAAVILIPSLILSFLYLIPDEEADRYMEVKSNCGLVSSLELPDGSKVWLNSGSYIKYPVRFAKSGREVYITGEAYLSVVKEENRKFLVRTLDNLSVEVTGTEFNIDASEARDKITTTLVEGGISLCYNDRNGGLKKYSMTPGQQTVYSGNTGKLSVQDTYIPKDIAWKNGLVIFRNTPFDEALWILSKRFNVEFIIKKESLRDYSFTGTFTDQNLTRILEHFRISSGINYSQRQVVSDGGEILKSEIDLY